MKLDQLTPRRVALATVAFFPVLALAHSGTTLLGFWDGLNHPVLGVDHFLAMLSVGILSAQMGGRAVWTVPATFVAVMAVGGAIGMRGLLLPGVEYWIAVSVLALGISITTEKKMPQYVAMAFVGMFAIFHGFAHGAEMPIVAEPVLYALGFMTGTAAIHLAGVLIGLVASHTNTRMQVLRYVGAGIAGVGVHILLIT